MLHGLMVALLYLALAGAVGVLLYYLVAAFRERRPRGPHDDNGPGNSAP